MSARSLTIIVRQEPASESWFYGRDSIPLDGEGATFYELVGGGDSSPCALIELADGSVFTTDDVFGCWS